MFSLDCPEYLLRHFEQNHHIPKWALWVWPDMHFCAGRIHKSLFTEPVYQNKEDCGCNDD